ncbi:MAG: AlpA family phage regulatory protein [Thiolinea sp.]
MADKTKVPPLVPALSAQDRAVKLPELIQLTGKSKTSIYREIKAGRFPAGVSIGIRARAWSLNAVNSWLEQCKQEAI